MTIEWTKEKEHSEYYYGKTATRFSVQIGRSTTPEKYMWMIFHDDFLYCVYGDETESADQAKRLASEWLDSNAQLKHANA